VLGQLLGHGVRDLLGEVAGAAAIASLRCLLPAPGRLLLGWLLLAGLLLAGLLLAGLLLAGLLLAGLLLGGATGLSLTGLAASLAALALATQATHEATGRLTELTDGLTDAAHGLP
jgi:hypothetical protein